MCFSLVGGVLHSLKSFKEETAADIGANSSFYFGLTIWWFTFNRHLIGNRRQVHSLTVWWIFQTVTSDTVTRVDQLLSRRFTSWKTGIRAEKKCFSLQHYVAKESENYRWSYTKISGYFKTENDLCFFQVHVKALQVTDFWTALNFWMVSVKRIGECVEGSGHNLTWGLTLEFTWE